MNLDYYHKFQKCISELERIGNEYAEAKGQSWQMQELRSSVLSKLIHNFCNTGGIPISRSEVEARASEEYQEYVKETSKAITRELKLKSQYEKEKSVFEALRSLSSLEKKLIEKAE